LNCYCTGPNSVISENLLKNGAKTSTCRTGVIGSFYYELPNDSSSGIETCSSVECHLLNRIPFDFLDSFKFLTLAQGCLHWSSSLAHYEGNMRAKCANWNLRTSSTFAVGSTCQRSTCCLEQRTNTEDSVTFIPYSFREVRHAFRL
jgi:hypothetical protein